MHKTKALTAKVDIPSRWLPGDDVEVTASNGYDYHIWLPEPPEKGEVVLYAEAAVPVGAEPGDVITVFVTDPIVRQLDLEEQLEIEVPEGYEADDLIVFLLAYVSAEGAAVADIDWDASWKSFRAPVEEPTGTAATGSSILEKAATSRHRDRQSMEPRPSDAGPSAQRVRRALHHALSDTAWVALSVLATLLACAPAPSWS